MRRAVFVSRCKVSGRWVLNPQGTFRGYGAYVGIYPYRQLRAESSPGELGAAAMRLLSQSGPTGFHIRDHLRHNELTVDDETQDVLAWLHLKKATTSELARRFILGTVETKDLLKSWIVVRDEYSSQRRAMEPALEVRIRKSEGAAALGAALQRALNLVPPRAGVAQRRRITMQ